MRRVRLGVLLLSVVGLLLGPTPGAAKAQTPPDFNVGGTVVGETDPDPSPHTLGVNRNAGGSAFDGVNINAVIQCEDEIVEIPDFETENAHKILFWADDDVTDGFGEITATETGRAFHTDVATGVRAGGIPSATKVRVRIVTGRFHRLGNVVEVDLRLDIRVERDDEGLICQTRSATEPEVRLVLLIVGPGPDGDGFTLVGTVSRHLTDIDRTSVARTVCEAYPVDTRVSEPNPNPLSGTVGPGRGDFHPCLTPYHGA